MELQELKSIGLSNGEIKVYASILNIGVASLNQINEKTGLERRGIYDIINKLIDKGLVSYTLEKGKKRYRCAPPKHLREEILRKKAEIKSIETIMPKIEEMYKNVKPSIDVQVFRGKEGIKAVFEDMLNYKDVYFIGGRWYVVKEMPLFWASYNKRRIEVGVKWHNLVLHDSPSAPTKKLVSVKTLPQDFSGSPSLIWIYGNKIVNVLWGEDYFAFMIENKNIAENYKKYFNYLWKIAKS